MATDLSILIGLHDADTLEWTKTSAEVDGFKVYTASTLDEMKVLMKAQHYRGYLMDLNLGIGGVNISPAQEIYALVRYRVEQKEAVFLGVSGRYEAVEAALREHIPAEIKPFHIFPFLQQCKEVKGK